MQYRKSLIPLALALGLLTGCGKQYELGDLVQCTSGGSTFVDGTEYRKPDGNLDYVKYENGTMALVSEEAIAAYAGEPGREVVPANSEAGKALQKRFAKLPKV